MKYVYQKNKINWSDLNNVVKKNNIIFPVPGGFLAFRANGDLLSDINYFVNSLKNVNKSHWFLFYYEANWGYLDRTVEDNQFDEIDFKNDVMLLSDNGKVIDGFNFLKKEFSDVQAAVNFFNVFIGRHPIISELTYRSKDVEQIGNNAESFLSSHTLGRYHLDPAAAPLTGVSYEYKTPSYNQYNYGYGRSFDFKTSKCIASLEAVERYASEFYCFDYSKNSIESNLSELKKRYENEQTKMPHINFADSVEILPLSEIALEKKSEVDSETSLYWTYAHDIRMNKTVLVPEDLVYYGNNPSREGYIRAINDSSNGVALGSYYAEAMISAVLELMERHSFLMTWYGQVNGRNIFDYKKCLQVEEKAIIDDIESDGAKVHFYEVSVFKDVYVVWGLIIDSRDEAIISTYTSAGSGFSLQEALRSALMEVSVGYLVQKRYHRGMPSIPNKLSTIDDHIDYYANSANIREFDFVKKFERSSCFAYTDNLLKLCSTSEEVLKHLLDITLKDYKRILFANLTSKEMEKRELFVVKAIIPEMLPMTFGEGNLRVDIKNINKSRNMLGLKPVSKIDNRPHPFP